MSEVFISYARSTVGQARAIEDGLRALGYGVWRDDELPAHRDYSDVIEERLRAAKAVVVAWSAEAVRSQWVRAEADIAREAGSLVQLTLDGAPLPLPFNRIQCADLRDWTGDLAHPGWTKVAASVAELAGAASPRAPAARGEPLLAVLAFDNLSGDPDMAYFSDGVSEEILDTVARGSSLKVIARSSSFQFRGPDKAVRRVVADLKATHLLDGSVRRAGSRVRIAAQLVDCASETTLWSERFDRELSDVFALQDEIAGAVAAALEVAFNQSRLAARPIDPAAYDLYLKARDYSALSYADLGQIAQDRIALLERAVALAPDFAPAWAWLAEQRVWLANLERGEQSHEMLLAGAWEALDTAERLDATMGVTRATRSRLEPYAAYQRREALLREALQLAPGDMTCLAAMGDFLFQVGRRREARPVYEDRATRNPLHPYAASAALFASDLTYEQFQAAVDALRAKWPAFFDFTVGASTVAAGAGDWPKYDALARHALDQPFAPRPSRMMRDTLQFWNAVRDGDRAYLDGFVETVLSAAKLDGTVWLDELRSLGAIGRLDEAFAAVEHADFKTAFEPGRMDFARGYSPALIFNRRTSGPLIDDPRFLRLCAKLGLVSYWLETERWPDCADQVPYDFRAEAGKVAAEGLARHA